MVVDEIGSKFVIIVIKMNIDSNIVIEKDNFLLELLGMMNVKIFKMIRNVIGIIILNI